MKRRPCWNCCTWVNGVLCVDCARMILATVVGELLTAAIIGGVVWLIK